MDMIENKVQQLKELSKKHRKLNEIKQDIADILGNANMNEKRKIAEQMSKVEYESMDQAKNLQFIVPHVVKELYEHEGPKGEFIIPKKNKPEIKPVVELTEQSEGIPEPVKAEHPKGQSGTVVIEPEVEPIIKPIIKQVVETIVESVIEPVVKKKESAIEVIAPVITEKKGKKASTRKNFLKKIKGKTKDKGIKTSENNPQSSSDKNLLESSLSEQKDLQKMMDEINSIADGLNKLKEQNTTTEDELKKIQEEKMKIENQLGENPDEKKE